MKKERVSRRRFLKSSAAVLGAGSLGIGLSFVRGCGGYSSDKDKPNVILITADDLGWKDLSCYVNQDIQTPNLDRLANEGIRFKRAFVVSSSCAPSRASLITGQYPHTNGVTGLTHVYKWRSLRPGYDTLANILRENDYNTALEGKWHVSPYLPTTWYGYNERLTGVFPGTWNIDNPDRAVNFIRENKDNRFYIEINFMQNHRDNKGAFHYDPDFYVDPEDIHVPEYYNLPDIPELRLEIAKYYSQTKDMDYVIGKIMDELDNLGIADNTLIVFISDNGPPFPGNKMTLYDRGAAVPLIIKLPGKIKAGLECDHLVNSIDVMPTVLELAGIPVPEDVEGKSLVPLLSEENAAPVQEAIFMEMTAHVNYLPTRAVRTDNWKYIKNFSDIDVGLDQNSHMEWAQRIGQQWVSPRVQEELYYIPDDPHEQINLADDERYKDNLIRMRKLLEENMRKTNDPFLEQAFTSDYSTK